MTIKVRCSVQFAVWRSQNLIKSHFSFRQQIISFKEAKIPLGERKNVFERAKIIIYANCKTCLNRVDPYERKIPQFVKPKS